MTNLNPIHCAQARAHLARAEAARLEAAARDARRRYFRELEAIDLMLGRGPSPFGPLG